MEALQLNYVKKRFGEFEVIAGLSISIPKGQIISILGRSGIGKTTLLNIISGLDNKYKGKIKREGRIAYLTQKEIFLPWRTMLENVLLPDELQGQITKKKICEAKELMKKAGLKENINSYPHELSGGMQRKCSIIRALIQNKEIYLLDEPLSSIDFNTRLRYIKILRDLFRKKNNTVIWVTHDIDEAIAVSDRVIILGKKPSTVLSDIEIKIDERTPEKMRENVVFHNYFNKIWRMLKNEAS